MKLSDVQTVVAAMAAIDLSTPNEGGNVREAQRAVKKIPLECFDGAKAIFIDSDKKEYPAVLTGARIDWISRTEINARKPENGITLVARGRVQYNSKESAFRSGVCWPHITSDKATREAVFKLILEDAAPAETPKQSADEPVLAGPVRKRQ